MPRQFRGGYEASRINKLITANKKDHFKVDAVTRPDELAEWFDIPPATSGSYKDLTKHNLALVNAQEKLNKLLRHKGLVMRSRNYYSEFYIIGQEQATAKANLYARGSATKAYDSRVTRIGASISKWTKMADSDAELAMQRQL